jgi:hypothetical protein
MKKMLVITSIVLLFTAAAMADGSGLPPVKPPKAQPVVVTAITAVPYLVADGGGLPPVCGPKQPVKCPSLSLPLVADGSGLPPVKPHLTAPPLVADGSGLPPVKPHLTALPLVADGSGLPPVKRPVKPRNSELAV